MALVDDVPRLSIPEAPLDSRYKESDLPRLVSVPLMPPEQVISDRELPRLTTAQLAEAEAV